MSFNKRPPVSIKVDNISYRTMPDDLKRQFDKFGEIDEIYIPKDYYTRENKGYAFVRFHTKHGAENALDRRNRIVVDGREIRVQMARQQRPYSYHKRFRRPYYPYQGRKRSRSRDYSRSVSRSESRSASRSPRDKSTDKSRSGSKSENCSFKKSRSRS